MKQIDSYLFGPVSAARPYLMIKAVLLLLAFDAWVVMIEHGGRYGVGDFNVSHFQWLDAIQPVPSSGLYVGLMLFAGLLAFAIAAGGTQRVALAVLAVAYAYGWMMSMLDSYQHHYLLSIVLVAFIGWPAFTAREVFGAAPIERPTWMERAKRGPPATAWAYALACGSIAIVYAYTALAKTEEDWRMGHALQRIAPEPMAPFEAYFVGSWGMAPDTFWALVGHSVIGVQVVIAAAYVAAPVRDRGYRGIAIVCWIGFFAAASFHLGAEHLGLRIGWFSWYMLAIAAICFLPGTLVHAVGLIATWPVRKAGALWQRTVERQGFGAAIPAAIGAGLVVGIAGYKVDMPGSLTAGVAAAVAVVGAVVFLFVRGRVAETLRWIAACGAGGLLMWLSIAATDLRFDYYRKVGGVMRRHGEWAEAYEAYRKANLYAPPGRDRRDKEEEMRQRMRIEGPRAP